MDVSRLLGGNINLPLGKLTFSPSILQAGIIIFLLFLFVFLVGSDHGPVQKASFGLVVKRGNLRIVSGISVRFNS